MNSTRSIELLEGNPRAPACPLLTSLARRVVLQKLENLQHGTLNLIDGDERYTFGDGQSGPIATVHVRDRRFYPQVAFGGSVGAGESYMSGDWQCSDLTSLVCLLLRNREVVDGIDSGIGKLLQPLNSWFHRRRQNSRAGARRNISAHYDLGNDFFKLFLDDTMMYSSAVFATPDTPLREASIAKLDMICRKLELTPDDHLLEIGTGWGGFAVYAAQHYGCRVTTTTISREQFELARQRVAAAGLEDRITLLLEDYRDLTGQYDKVVSIEMIEAIGEEQIPVFFRVCADRLKPNGRLVVQGITIADRLYASYRKSVDFIQRHIFPGGFLPCVASLTWAVAHHSDLRMVHLEDIGPHYATTLRRWRENFFARIEDIRDQGYPEAFVRLWEFYFCYCEGGFLERTLGNVQMVLVKPEERGNGVFTPALPSR